MVPTEVIKKKIVVALKIRGNKTKQNKTPEKYVYFITESDPSSLSKRVIQYKIEFFLKDTTK